MLAAEGQPVIIGTLTSVPAGDDGAVLGSFSSGNADPVGWLLGPYRALPMVVYLFASYLRDHYSRSW
jgi:hypothetical protein